MKRRRLNPETLSHLEPTGERSQPGPVALSHRKYENIFANGHSRNVYGDIYNTYHVNSQDNAGIPAPPSVDTSKATDDVAGELMQALAFDQMGTRLATTSTAHAETCQWLFAREEYTSWRDPEALHKHHGLFWIKGKPGAGKSTLMKCARQYGDNTHKDLTISFFFHARSGDLERSAEGMYRSLLYQLLEGMPCLAPSLGKFTLISTKQSWPLAELEDMLVSAVHALSTNAVICYIDALDECDDEDARKMIEHFETLGQCATKADTGFRVLLSSRHYPHIFLDRCLELNLGDQEEHESDIAEYIRCKLKIGKERLALQLQDDIRMRACGVFLWVVLVVRILNECDARGKTHLLKKRLATVPDGLSELFEEILQRGAHDLDETLLTFQWILSAQRPLEREALYFAVTTSSSDDAIEKWDSHAITPKVMERFLLDSSKGLAELTKGKFPRVQFIHESVRDFLLYKGFALVNPELSEDILSVSHERLRDCCLRYLKNSQAALLRTPTDGVKEHMSNQRARVSALRVQVARTHPVLKYAVQGILYHGNLAHTRNMPQNLFVADFPHAMWRRYYNMCCSEHYSRMKVETQPLYTFVAMKALELARIEIQIASSHVESRLEGEDCLSLLDAAVSNKDHRMMDILFENGAVANDHHCPPASSYLFRAIRIDDPTMVRTLIDHGAGPMCVDPSAHREPVLSSRYVVLCAISVVTRKWSNAY